MKKMLLLLFAAVVMVLPACNEDATEYDAAYTSQLKGTWSKTTENSEFRGTETYRFDDTKFTYTNTTLNIKETKERYFTYSGTWNVYKGVLQLCYDLESLRTDGYTETEEKNIYNQMSDSNIMLSQMNAEDKPFGGTIEFDVLNDQEILRLGGVNGYFVRVK